CGNAAVGRIPHLSAEGDVRDVKVGGVLTHDDWVGDLKLEASLNDGARLTTVLETDHFDSKVINAVVWNRALQLALVQSVLVGRRCFTGQPIGSGDVILQGARRGVAGRVIGLRARLGENGHDDVVVEYGLTDGNQLRNRVTKGVLLKDHITDHRV